MGIITIFINDFINARKIFDYSRLLLISTIKQEK